jgi:WD40 repeat protein
MTFAPISIRSAVGFFALLALVTGCGPGVSLDPSHPPGGPGGGSNLPGFQAGPCGQLGTGSARAVAYSPDGLLVAVAYGSGAVALYQAADGSPVRHLAGHDRGVGALVFSPDGALLVTGGDDGVIKTWRVADGSLAWMAVADHIDSVSSVAFSPDGTLVASTGIEGVLALWHTDGGTKVWSLALQMFSQQTVFFTPDGATVVSHPFGGALVQFHHVSDGHVVKEIGLGNLVRLGGISPDGSLLVGYVEDPVVGHSVAAFKVTDGSPAWRIQTAHTDNIMGAVFSPDGSTVASTSWDATIKIWRASNGDPLRTIAEAGAGAAVAFSPDGAAVAGGTMAGDLATFRVADGAPMASVAAPPGHAGNVFQVTFSPDGSLLATVALSNDEKGDRSAKIWRVADGSLLRTIPDAGGQTVQALAFSPDGASVVVTNTADRRAHMVGVADGVEITAVSNMVAGVAVSPDGATIATNCSCAGPAWRPVRLWKLDGTEELGVGDLNQAAGGFAFSPDGATLAVAQMQVPSEPVTLKLWRLSDRSEVWQADLPGGNSPGSVALAFSPDGSRIAASGLFASNLAIFRTSDGARLHGNFFDPSMPGMTTGALSFSSDGALLGVATTDGLAVFRTSDWARAGTLGQPNSFIGTAFSPAAPRAAAAGQNGVIYQWCDIGL